MKLVRTSHRLRRRVLVLLALPLAVGATLLIPGTAMAANGGDPQTTGCSNSEITDLSVNMYNPNNGVYMGTEYLRYSTGCGTEWVTVDLANGYSAAPSVWMQNQGGTDLYTAEDTGSVVWTYQLSNMQSTAACGGAQMYNPSGSWVAWEYIGCE